MPATYGRNLTVTLLPPLATTVRLQVTYNAVFNVFERHLAGLGLVFQERIQIIGVDPPGGTSGRVLHTFPNQTLPVTDGSSPQNISRNRFIIVSRASLQEDPGIGDADELRARIQILAIGLPSSITLGFTDQEVLPG